MGVSSQATGRRMEESDARAEVAPRALVGFFRTSKCGFFNFGARRRGDDVWTPGWLGQSRLARSTV